MFTLEVACYARTSLRVIALLNDLGFSSSTYTRKGRSGEFRLRGDPATLDAAALCKMADRNQIEGGLLDGPLAFDNAISAEAAHTKGLSSPVAGDPDILLVPDLESGNMLAKQLQYLAGAGSAGVVVGARVPIALTSRADGERARMASCAVMVLAAGMRLTRHGA